MQGILLIDKLSGWTSFDVVNYVRRMVAEIEGKKPKNCKVGHTGTLDPLATGLLVVLVGKEYTRGAADLSKHDKTYEVTMKLGEISSTGDEEGEKTPVVCNTTPTEKTVLEALGGFQGHIMQTPPAYSAMKVNGVRAYKLAREGKEVVLEPRPVVIHSVELTGYEYPFVRFSADVGSGTYIRSLVEDVGRVLGTGAYMSDLRRIRVGDFELGDAFTTDQVSTHTLAEQLMQL